MSLIKNWKLPGSSPTSNLALGNKARDDKDWLAASEAYKRHLEDNPDDVAIWVQYAHVLKEQELLIEAEAAYRMASTLSPTDVDSRLHLAHLLKRLDRPRQAIVAFRELMELSPSGEVMTELQNLGDGPQAQVLLANRPVPKSGYGRCIELKDLFQYLSLHTTVTGITRVTLGLVNYLLEDVDETEAENYRFVHQFGDAEGVLLIPATKMRRVVKMAMSETPNLGAMQDLIGEIRSTSPLIQLQPGDVYLIVGAFWEFVANPSWIGGMKQRGVLIGAYIYDLIPITHAHYCMSALTEAFTAAFAETARLLDFALTISEFVAKQVTDYVAKHNIVPFPTVAVPLAHELRFVTERARQERQLSVSPRLDELGDLPFVLCICTIEARKNHIYLFYIWQRMIEAGLDVPDLVFVGRPGWRIQDLFDQIEASRNLDGRLHIMHGLSDQDLEALYDRCLFTVFPSFVEGWGLPVGESLARGKVCVASSTTSIPEVGGDLAVYVDPFNLEDGYEKISGLIKQPASLAVMEAKLRTTFVARTWSDVGKDFFTKTNAILTGLSERSDVPPPYAPYLTRGALLDVRTMRNVGARGVSYVLNPERLVFVEGWRGVEVTGTWMRDATATLRVATDCEPDQSVSVLCHVGLSPWVGLHNTLRMSASNKPTAISHLRRSGGDKDVHTRPMSPDADLWIKLKGIVGADRCLTVRFRVDGAMEVQDKSHVAVTLRLHALGYAPANDVEARLDLLEQVWLTPSAVELPG